MSLLDNPDCRPPQIKAWQSLSMFDTFSHKGPHPYPLLPVLAAFQPTDRLHRTEFSFAFILDNPVEDCLAPRFEPKPKDHRILQIYRWLPLFFCLFVIVVVVVLDPRKQEEHIWKKKKKLDRTVSTQCRRWRDINTSCKCKSGYIISLQSEHKMHFNARQQNQVCALF